MTAYGRWLRVGVLAVLALAGGAWAQDASSVSPLLTMLAQVPNDTSDPDDVWASVRFADYEALFSAEGLEILRALGSVDLLMESVPIGAILNRIVSGPEAVNYLFSSTGMMLEAVGFEWLLDVDRSLEFGDPPWVGLVLDGQFDVEKVGLALQKRGFSLTDVNGVSVWHRFEDMSVSLADRNVADPFGGYLGAAARIAILPEGLANARSWPLINAIIGAAQNAQPSLADDPDYRALAEAVSGAQGSLIQALFFTPDVVGYPGVSTQPGGQASTDGADLLPSFSLSVLADLQDGDDQVHVIGLTCIDEPTAQTAAEVLAQRITQFRLPDHDERLVERFGASVSRSVLPAMSGGPAVALVEVRYPLPVPRTDPETGWYTTGGLIYRSWIQAILRREFSPLW